MTLKNMVRIYLDNYLDEGVWDTFHRMSCYGIISVALWEKFYKKCAGWTLSDDGCCVVDFAQPDKAIYVADGAGILQPVK